MTGAVTERALRFMCQGQALMGIVHVPQAPPELQSPGDLGLLVVVGGPQYRGGSHRQFVQLARAVAAEGHAVLRFDVRGMGDSEGAFAGFEHLSEDIGAAIDALQREVPAVRRVVLWGLCDGASAALLYLDETGDARVAGLCLANPWVRDAVTQARVQVKHYYRERLGQRSFWAKLLRGGVGGDAARGLLQALRLARSGRAPAAAGFQQRMARAWRAFEGPVLLLLSGRDHTAKEFLERVAREAGAWPLAAASTQRVALAEADHTFSSPAAGAGMAAASTQWLRHLSLAVHGIVLAGMVAVCPAAPAAEPPCGALDNAYGPFDYRTQQQQLAIVDRYHFTPAVEGLVKGTSGTLEGDLDYTLRASPNHHRALLALMRLGEKKRSTQPGSLPRPIECYFERALRFRPQDEVVRMIYAKYLIGAQRSSDALQELAAVAALDTDNPLTHVNCGLLYLELKAWDQALAQAHQAMRLGHPATALKEALQAQGRWKEPDPAAGS
jgi:exosortase A-associated hydrolase 1